MPYFTTMISQLPIQLHKKIANKLLPSKGATLYELCNFVTKTKGATLYLKKRYNMIIDSSKLSLAPKLSQDPLCFSFLSFPVDNENKLRNFAIASRSVLDERLNVLSHIGNGKFT